MRYQKLRARAEFVTMKPPLSPIEPIPLMSMMGDFFEARPLIWEVFVREKPGPRLPAMQIGYKKGRDKVLPLVTSSAEFDSGL